MFGIEIPKSVEQALLELDKANGNNLWRESIDKELEQINDFQTFRRLKKGEHLSAAYQRIPYFIVFANKFDGRRKARLVANGSRCEMDSAESYSGVVGMETVRLGFLLAEMNRLKICAADIGSAYLHGKTENCVTSSPDLNSEISRVRNSSLIKASTVSSPAEQGFTSIYPTGSEKWDIVPAKRTRIFG
jgi:hypothetical protein